MKTVMTKFFEYLDDFGLGINEENKAKFLIEEKQQHEKTAIHITNVLMDALDNPKGGKFSGEDEFNKYWDKTYKA